MPPPIIEQRIMVEQAARSISADLRVSLSLRRQEYDKATGNYRGPRRFFKRTPLLDASWLDLIQRLGGVWEDDGRMKGTNEKRESG